MLRKAFCLLTLGLVLFAGGCSSSDDENLPNLTGTWKMVTSGAYNFDLILTQNGATISGTMVRTNGTEPTDTVTGTVDASNTATFTRVRTGTGGWTQTYVGVVTTTGGIMSMNGTYTGTQFTGAYLWQATKS